ncbi:MAG: methylmalonyl-CoA mutase family protein [Propionibacteriaceae bacterium]|nr:methylmalonyl-CoA mutase family protein [Propionibacteriaceae bacterium]
MADHQLALAGDFPPPTAQQWQGEVCKVMNRRRPPEALLDFDQAAKKLTTTTVDGVTIEPLYTHPNGQRVGWPGRMPLTRGGHEPCQWVVAQLQEDPNVSRSHDAVTDDLGGGGTGVWLRVDQDALAASDLAKVLDGVTPKAVQLAVSSVGQQAEAGQALLDYLSCSGTGVADYSSLGIDPLGAAAVTGAAADLSVLADWVGRAKAWPGLRAITVDATVYDNAGAGDIHQLAFAVASGIEYVRALASQGVDATTAFQQVVFRVAVNADQFGTIARLRALRRLWARVGEVLGVPEAKRGAVQHAVTSWRMISRDDPWVNILRQTTACFAAAVGGAEVITTLPHDTAWGLPSRFSRRVARNVQLLAAEEAHVGAVQDPAGGSWFVEALTEQMANKAWTVVQQIEAAGGMAKALTDGLVAQLLAPVVNERARRVATRALPITGVSMFPKPDEAPPADVVDRPGRPKRAGLAQHRDAEVFEALRDRAAAFEAARGARPAVLLACLGQQRSFGPRETFTSNVFWVAGIDTPRIEDATPDAIVAAATGHPIVVLASSGAVYAEQAIAVAKALKAAGVAQVCIAGRKTETGSDDAGTYIDQEIFDGMDIVAFLTRTLDCLEAN